MYMRSTILPVALLALAFAPSVHARTKTCEVEYALDANLKLSDTPMGQGDGIYHVGPGRAVLRFEGNDVKMLEYTMDQHFKIEPSAIFWSATLFTDARARATPDGDRVVARGVYDGRSIRWLTPLRDYRVDGTLRCEGSLCGKFGAPPRGTSQLHAGPYAQALKPFVFSPDHRVFTMATTPGLKTESPKQSSEVAVRGIEVRRTCE